MTKTTEERFEEKVDRSGDCHLWIAARFKEGYGQFWSGEYRLGTKNPKVVYAHRWAYEHFVGPIPEGLFVCHTCDNPPCVNLDHLFLGTHTDNMADMYAKGRGHKASPQGEHHHWSKLTEDDVREIRRRYDQGETQAAIAADYGNSQPNVSAIVNRKIWTHIK